MAGTIQVTHEGSVATVTLSRPDVHNALNPEMIDDLAAAFTELGTAPGTRVILLAAAGRSFCAGADLNWMRAAAGAAFEENVADARRLAGMLRTIHDCPKPVIVRVHGAAFGGGVGVVAACDLAAAADGAAFCFSEARLGLVPAVISPFVLRRVSPGAAKRYFMTAERFSAPEARRIGLVSETAASTEAVDAQIRDWVRHFLENGPEAVAACKRLVDEVVPVDWERILERMAQEIAQRRAGGEGREGMAAFLEKRAPSWREEHGDVP